MALFKARALFNLGRSYWGTLTCNAQLNEALPFSAGDRRNISRGIGGICPVGRSIFPCLNENRGWLRGQGCSGRGVVRYWGQTQVTDWEW